MARQERGFGGGTSPHLYTQDWTPEQLTDYVNERKGRVFAILDSAEEPLVWDKVDELGHERCLSLFNGWAAIKYKKIAPYIAVVDAALLEWIRSNLGQKPWGIFMESRAGLKEIRRHCHTLLMVRQPDGENVYLRFYDPRITPGFVDCCNPEELDTIFKDRIDSLIVERRGQVKVIRKFT